MAHLITLLDGDAFFHREELTLLEVLELEKIKIDYQCRDGFCGSCQIKLINGNVEYINSPIAFISDGNVLACSCKPCSDIMIELNN